MNKLRVDGKTIDPKKQYSGREVIELLNVSYANGYNKARREVEEKIESSYTNGYNEGYSHGYDCAAEDLKQFKILLNRILKN